ncbi:MAG: SAM-dependent methyltransferase [Nitrososphaeraceae archaeon]
MYNYSILQDNETEVLHHYAKNTDMYLQTWGNLSNLAIHMGYFDKLVKSHEESLSKMNEYLFNIAKISKSDNVLDAGCGIGGTSIWLAKQHGIKTTGISLVNEEIELAKKFANENKVNHLVDFFEMNYNYMNFSNGSFDVIMGIESICHSLNKMPFFRESQRLLNENGRLIISDCFLHDHTFSHIERNQINKISIAYSQTLCSFSKIREFLKNANFINIYVFDITDNVLPSYIHGINYMKKMQKNTVDSKLKNKIHDEIYRTTLEFQCMTKGIIRYGVIYSEKGT